MMSLSSFFKRFYAATPIRISEKKMKRRLPRGTNHTGWKLIGNKYISSLEGEVVLLIKYKDKDNV